VHMIRLWHPHSGFMIEVLEYGAILRAVYVPDRQQRLINTVLSYETLADYESDRAYLGAVIGRCANRIANGVAMIDGRRIQLTCNEGPHQLHGGAHGFAKALWRVIELHDGDAPCVVLAHHCVHGTEGYPGDVQVRLRLQITSPLSFSVLISATTHQPTPLNMTLHPYFNLNGDAATLIDNHHLRLHAASILQTTEEGIPTGENLDLTGTPFDFREPGCVGTGLEKQHPQQRIRAGYDHYFVLDHPRAVAAVLFSPASGIALRLNTNQAGIQLYSSGWLYDSSAGRFADRAGLCLEPHGFPNAVNEPRFPSVMLLPEETYRHSTHFEFSVR